MLRLTLTFLTTLTIWSTCLAQPGIDWMRMYDNNQNEQFHDVFATAGDGYVMCGRTWIDRSETSDFYLVRVNNIGQVEWQSVHVIENTYDYASSLIQADNGNILSAGRSGANVAALMTDRDGETIWFRQYRQGGCHAVIELKGGEFLLAGYTGQRGQRNGYLLCIEGDGDVLWDGEYDGHDDSDYFYTMRETEGGVVVAGWTDIPGDNSIDVWVVKVDLDGDLIWSSSHSISAVNFCTSMVSSEEGGFALAGYTNDANNGPNHQSHDMILMKINDVGELEWSERYDWGEDEGAENALCLERLADGEYILVGYQSFYQLRNLVLRARRNGQTRWQRLYEFDEEDGFGERRHNFTSVIRGHDNSILAAGTTNIFHFDEFNQDGLLMKLEPEHLQPMIIFWSPEDTLQTILPGDSLRFIVRAVDQQGDELEYLWFLGEDQIGRDTTVTVIFEELGENIVQCQVSDEDFTTSIRWHVTASEWYIDSINPDSTEITLRRGTSIDFTHHVRAVEDFDFDYRWEHFGRGGNFEFDGEDSVRYNFDLTGEHLIRAWVINEGESETIEWDVNVRSIVWWWWPHDLTISAHGDTTIAFEVFPFNEEPDSLECIWTLNDNEIGDGLSFEVNFPEVGQHIVTALVTEGVEADTVRWEIGIGERNTVPLTALQLPQTPTLFPPTPNPFNSQARISYAIHRASQLKISVHDLAGREITVLIDGYQNVGTHSITWDTNSVVAGVYIIKMEGEDFLFSQKIVCVK